MYRSRTTAERAIFEMSGSSAAPHGFGCRTIFGLKRQIKRRSELPFGTSFRFVCYSAPAAGCPACRCPAVSRALSAGRARSPAAAAARGRPRRRAGRTAPARARRRTALGCRTAAEAHPRAATPGRAASSRRAMVRAVRYGWSATTKATKSSAASRARQPRTDGVGLALFALRAVHRAHAAGARAVQHRVMRETSASVQSRRVWTSAASMSSPWR